MRPLDIQQIGDELAIKWDDGSESYISQETLRRCCPCAGCRGETDIMGNVYGGAERPTAYSQGAFKLVSLRHVGGYAIQPQWADGHATGLFAYEFLKQLGEGSGDTDSAQNGSAIPKDGT